MFISIFVVCHCKFISISCWKHFLQLADWNSSRQDLLPLRPMMYRKFPSFVGQMFGWTILFYIRSVPNWIHVGVYFSLRLFGIEFDIVLLNSLDRKLHHRVVLLTFPAAELDCIWWVFTIFLKSEDIFFYLHEKGKFLISF